MSNPHVLLSKDYTLLTIITYKSKYQFKRVLLFRKALLLQREIKRKISYKSIKSRARELYQVANEYVLLNHFKGLAYVLGGLAARCFVIGSELEKFE